MNFMNPSDILESLKFRYAVKVFDPTIKLSSTQIHVLTESLRLSASSFGLQPWKFVVVESTQMKEKLLPHSWGQKQVVDCSHHIVFCSLKEMDANFVDNYVSFMSRQRGVPQENLKGYRDMMVGHLNSKNPEQIKHWMENQVYLALGTLLSACAVMGVDACPMEGIDKSKYDEILDLDKYGVKTVVACPVGIRSEKDQYAKLKKVRFAEEDVIIRI